MNTSQQHTAQIWGVEIVSRRFANALTLTLTVMIVLSLGASALAQSAVPYIYGPLSPGQKAPGAGTFTLTVYGTGFASGAGEGAGAGLGGGMGAGIGAGARAGAGVIVGGVVAASNDSGQ